MLEFRPMSDASVADYLRLNSDPKVTRHLPLSDPGLDESACAEWLAGKLRQWDEFGYGPWAFFVDGEFAGWGGLQDEHGDADVGMVLLPRYWGCGRLILAEIVRRAFEEMGLESITALLPQSRQASLGRLGFAPDGEVDVHGERFNRFRMQRPR
jgi:RimJ/RimL family protein N-acetyltransferase